MHIHHLDISFGNVKRVGALASLLHLEELHVDGNPLMATWYEALAGLSCLRRLSARKCNLTQFGRLDNLVTLDLSYNSFETMQWLDELPDLQCLSLGECCHFNSITTRF
jgi:hypothetical protein